MGDTKQGSGKGKGKGKAVEKNYNLWTMEESNELLRLMVDGATRGWHDSSGSFNKTTVEKNILSVLNEKLSCQKTYAHYQSRMKWFKQRYTNFCNLMRFSSGFGWDPMTKKFTASNEV